jgi:hypothetical protein
MKNIICFLTVTPTKEFYDFSKTFKNDDYDVYIVIDNNRYIIPNYDGVIPVIQIDNKYCESYGYKNTLYYFKDRACARDKALYYFVMSKKPFKNLWLIEDDVFIPNTSIIPNIDSKYPNRDLLCKANKITKSMANTNEWHWPKIKPHLFIPLPWSCSLICAIRISPKLLGCIANYAKTHGTLFLDEALFTTLAIHNRLSIGTIDELSKLEFNKIWPLDEISEQYIYHPIKNFKDHIFLRNHLSNTIKCQQTLGTTTSTTSTNLGDVTALEQRLQKAIAMKENIEREISELRLKMRLGY